MAYKFVNQQSGKSQVQLQGSTTSFTLNGINTTTTDANVIMEGLTTLLGLVNWTVGEANRITTQDIEEES